MKYYIKFYDKFNDCLLEVFTKILFNQSECEFLSAECMIKMVCKDYAAQIKDVEIFEYHNTRCVNYIGFENMPRLIESCNLKNINIH